MEDVTGPGSSAPFLLADYIDKPGLTEELAKVSGKRPTIRTLDRWLLNGDGPAFTRIGKRVLFRRSAVLEWLRSRETPVRPQSKRNGRATR